MDVLRRGWNTDTTSGLAALLFSCRRPHLSCANQCLRSVISGRSPGESIGGFNTALQSYLQISPTKGRQRCFISQQSQCESYSCKQTEATVKVDILKAKLDNGIKVNKYVKNYAERPNDFDNVSKCGCVTSFSNILTHAAQSSAISFLQSTESILHRNHEECSTCT